MDLSRPAAWGTGMKSSCDIGHFRGARRWSVLALLLPLAAHALQSPPSITQRPAPMVLLPPPPAVQFRQAAQQQQLRDQLQKNQLQLQLQRSVSDTAKRSLPPAAPTRWQVDQAAAAHQDRQRAAQQDLLNRLLHTDIPPPVWQLEPARSRSGH